MALAHDRPVVGRAGAQAGGRLDELQLGHSRQRLVCAAQAAPAPRPRSPSGPNPAPRPWRRPRARRRRAAPHRPRACGSPAARGGSPAPARAGAGSGPSPAARARARRRVPRGACRTPLRPRSRPRRRRGARPAPTRPRRRDGRVTSRSTRASVRSSPPGGPERSGQRPHKQARGDLMVVRRVDAAGDARRETGLQPAALPCGEPARVESERTLVAVHLPQGLFLVAVHGHGQRAGLPVATVDPARVVQLGGERGPASQAGEVQGDQRLLAEVGFRDREPASRRRRPSPRPQAARRRPRACGHRAAPSASRSTARSLPPRRRSPRGRPSLFRLPKLHLSLRRHYPDQVLRSAAISRPLSPRWAPVAPIVGTRTSGASPT